MEGGAIDSDSDSDRDGARAPRRALRPLRALERRVGVSVGGMLTIAVVLALLFVISVPRLRSFARHENERDARVASVLLAAELAAYLDEHAAETPASAVEPPSIEHLAEILRHRLPDIEFLESGRTMRRHGYRFEIVRLAPPPPKPGEVLAAPPTPKPVLAVCAWPDRHGRSGVPTFRALADGRLLLHANHAGRWDGVSAPASEFTSWEGWRDR